MIKTKFGNARLNNYGYYIISSKKEGNNGKLLHRLIWESVWGKLPKDWVVHHIDGNKTNNCILNLLGMDKRYHIKLHNAGENNPNYGKKASEETRRKQSQSRMGRIISEEARLKQSKTTSTTRIFRVLKVKDERYSQGFRWRYIYTNRGKTRSLSSVDLDRLEKKVLLKGLPWERFIEN